jgi:hypothetical protein
MANAVIDGINTRYEVIGSGPPLLMYSPAGFDATLDKWTTQGVYARIKLLGVSRIIWPMSISTVSRAWSRW